MKNLVLFFAAAILASGCAASPASITKIGLGKYEIVAMQEPMLGSGAHAVNRTFMEGAKKACPNGFNIITKQFVDGENYNDSMTGTVVCD